MIVPAGLAKARPGLTFISSHLASVDLGETNPVRRRTRWSLDFFRRVPDHAATTDTFDSDSTGEPGR